MLDPKYKEDVLTEYLFQLSAVGSTHSEKMARGLEACFVSILYASTVNHVSRSWPLPEVTCTVVKCQGTRSFKMVLVK